MAGYDADPPARGAPGPDRRAAHAARPLVGNSGRNYQTVG